MTGIKPLYLAVEFLLNYYISCQPVQSTFPQTNHVSLLYSCIFSSMITRSKKMTRKQRTEGHRYSLSCLMQTCKTVAIDTKYQCKQSVHGYILLVYMSLDWKWYLTIWTTFVIGFRCTNIVCNYRVCKNRIYVNRRIFKFRNPPPPTTKSCQNIYPW